jgi:hypothetical protein
MMRRDGKVHWMIPVGVLGAMAVGYIALAPRETPTTVGAQFMDALARGDAKRLTDLSYTPDDSLEDLQKKWEFTVTYPGKHYWFKWAIKSEVEESDTDAKVMMGVDVGKGYEDNFTLPMTKQQGKWKVDAYGISRALYPGLPRREAL